MLLERSLQSTNSRGKSIEPNLRSYENILYTLLLGAPLQNVIFMEEPFEQGSKPHLQIFTSFFLTLIINSVSAAMP